jgi:pyrroloquinoline quinone (PQQ) biosynthesis protein C
MIDGRFEQATWLMAEIDHRRDWWAAERHPFYVRWSAGALTAEDLQAYAAEHHHVAATLADVTHRAAALADGLLRQELRRDLVERDHELEMWCEFAVAAGWPRSAGWWFGADPLPETELSAARWTGDAERPLASHLVTLYALETAVADVARPLLDALLGCYGFSCSASVAYFERRLRGDAGTAGLIEAGLTGLLPVADPFVLLRHAEVSYRAYWELLDGVLRVVTSPAPPAPRAAGAASSGARDGPY